MRIVLMSGISGAGKSTWIAQQDWYPNSITYSADHYFMKDGVYKFNPSELSLAHGQCLLNFIERCREGRYDDVIVVDNTNLTTPELAPYVAIAAAYQIPCELVTLDCDFRVALARNLHGIEEETVKRMRRALLERRLPMFWNIKHRYYRWNDETAAYDLTSVSPPEK